MDITIPIFSILEPLLILVPCFVLHELGHLLLIKWYGLKKKVVLKKWSFSIIAVYENKSQLRTVIIFGILAGMIPFLLYPTLLGFSLYVLGCLWDIKQLF